MTKERKATDFTKETQVTWLDEPEEHDYAAALDYLDLLGSRALSDAWLTTERAVKAMRKSVVTKKKVKDILRASELPSLAITNAHVHRDFEKVAEGVALSPVLLVRGRQRLIVADGYHRLLAVHWLDEDAEVPCKLV